MIGTFIYREVPRFDQVAIEIACTLDGRRIGSIKLAQHWRDAMASSPDYPSFDPMPIEASVCYGIFLAMRLRLSLVVTGDPSAWDPNWGRLIEAREIVPWLNDRFG